MFHRQFPETKLSATSIARVYKEGGVRFKFIKRVKKEIGNSNPYYLGLFNAMYAGVMEAKLKGNKIIYIDEAVFTFNTFTTKAWSVIQLLKFLMIRSR